MYSVVPKRLWATPEVDGRVVALQAALVNEPEPTDQIVEDHGSQVLVDKRVVRLLGGRILDVRTLSRLPSEFRVVTASK